MSQDSNLSRYRFHNRCSYLLCCVSKNKKQWPNILFAVLSGQDFKVRLLCDVHIVEDLTLFEKNGRGSGLLGRQCVLLMVAEG